MLNLDIPYHITHWIEQEERDLVKLYVEGHRSKVDTIFSQHPGEHGERAKSNNIDFAEAREVYDRNLKIFIKDIACELSLRESQIERWFPWPDNSDLPPYNFNKVKDTQSEVEKNG